MLPQVFTPGVQPEQFEKSLWLPGILVQSPPDRSISQPAFSQLTHDQTKMAEILRRSQISDGHQERTIVEFRLKPGVRFRQVRRGPEVDGFVDGERIEADQHQPR